MYTKATGGPCSLTIALSGTAEAPTGRSYAGPRPLDVLLAITESDLSTQVGRGENHGRLLRHTAVVRELRKLGRTSSGQFTARPQVSLKPDWRRQNLRAIVFLQDPSSLEITAAAQTNWK